MIDWFFALVEEVEEVEDLDQSKGNFIFIFIEPDKVEIIKRLNINCLDNSESLSKVFNELKINSKDGK